MESGDQNKTQFSEALLCLEECLSELPPWLQNRATTWETVNPWFFVFVFFFLFFFKKSCRCSCNVIQRDRTYGKELKKILQHYEWPAQSQVKQC